MRIFLHDVPSLPHRPLFMQGHAGLFFVRADTCKLSRESQLLLLRNVASALVMMFPYKWKAVAADVEVGILLRADPNHPARSSHVTPGIAAPHAVGLDLALRQGWMDPVGHLLRSRWSGVVSRLEEGWLKCMQVPYMHLAKQLEAGPHMLCRWPLAQLAEDPC